jgi:hypothetical protein
MVLTTLSFFAEDTIYSGLNDLTYYYLNPGQKKTDIQYIGGRE